MLKLSGEVFHGKLDHGIDFEYLENLCKEIAEVKKMGIELVIVIGGGNYWRYRDFTHTGIDRVHSDYMGMLATTINSIAMQDMFVRLGVKAHAVSAVEMPEVLSSYYRDEVLAELESGTIMICAGGTGSPFFTTDSAAALRALELKCDVLLKATKVDYIYDKDPAKYKNAKAYKELTYLEALEKKLAVMDLAAISLCSEPKLPVIVFNLQKKGNIAKAIKGDQIGTLVS